MTTELPELTLDDIESAPSAKPAKQAKPKGLIRRGKRDEPQRVLLYGPPKVGKTHLLSMVPNLLLVDTEGGAKEHDLAHYDCASYSDFIAFFSQPDDVFAEFNTIAVDTASRFVDVVVDHIVKTVPHEKGYPVNNIVDYGWGKGYEHVFNAWRRAYQLVEQQIAKGRNVIWVAHETVEKATNTLGEDYFRAEPQLQVGKNANIREHLLRNVDSIAYLAMDLAVKDGKGKGAGTRAALTDKNVQYIAGTRREPNKARYPVRKDSDGGLWDLLLKK